MKELDKFSDQCKPTKVNQKRSTTEAHRHKPNTEVKTVMKILLTESRPGLDRLTKKFCEIFFKSFTRNIF